MTIDTHTIISLIRDADEMFQDIGGSTRHYVTDILLPLMEKRGLAFCYSPLADSNQLPITVQWEYDIDSGESEYKLETISFLDKRGKDGWELILKESITSTTSKFFFKRAIVPVKQV